MIEDIMLEIARVEREALEKVRKRIAERQLGEAWVGLVVDHADNQVPVIEPSRANMSAPRSA
jgi:hypothetical protein